jgi:hypothetical protein
MGAKKLKTHRGLTADSLRVQGERLETLDLD